MSTMFTVECMAHVILFFTDGALKGHFGKVDLKCPPLSVAVKVLSLQHVREVVFQHIQGHEVHISVRCNDDPCLASLDPVTTYVFHHSNIMLPRDHLSLPVRHHPHQYVPKQPFEPSLHTLWRLSTLNCKPLETLYWCILGV